MATSAVFMRVQLKTTRPRNGIMWWSSERSLALDDLQTPTVGILCFKFVVIFIVVQCR